MGLEWLAKWFLYWKLKFYMKSNWNVSPFFISCSLLFVVIFMVISNSHASLKNAYLGCEEYLQLPNENKNSHERITSKRPPRVDPITERTFASFSLEEVAAGVERRTDNLCWFRLDGVWRETGAVVLDESRPIEGWASDTEELLTLANGTYTTPAYLYVEEHGHPETSLFIREGLLGTAFIEFTSSDGLSLMEVLKRGGPVKRYRATHPFIFGNQLTIDVSRSGRIRLKFNHKTFLRPKPGVPQSSLSTQLPDAHPFLLDRNLENLSASRKGYDVIHQDPFFLLQNPKYEVFARTKPQHYRITEKRTVPLGFSLIQEVAQGTVFWESIVSSEVEYQRSVANSFGARVGSVTDISASYPVAGVVGFGASKSFMESMKQSESVGQALGYSRTKQYALVVDHPYITLSNDFIDAVEDVRRYGNYSEFIRKFGTHYPYAVTYGAAAKMTQSFTRSSYTEIAQQNSSFKTDGGAMVYGVGGMVDYTEETGERSLFSGTIGDTGASFVAVGGNGSWNEQGYSAGNTLYPVLLDLRPLHELLNPMNFPGEPEIYTSIRYNLRLEVEEYLLKYNNRLNPASILPEVKERRPDPVEKWQVSVRQTWCGDHELINPVKQIKGTLFAEVQDGNLYTSKRKKSLVTQCKKKSPKKTWKAEGQNLITLTGTRNQLARKKLKYRFDWRYVPAFNRSKLSKQNKTYTLPLNKNLRVGQKFDLTWVVKGKAKLPQLRIRLRFKRVQ